MRLGIRVEPELNNIIQRSKKKRIHKKCETITTKTLLLTEASVLREEILHVVLVLTATDNKRHPVLRDVAVKGS